MGDFSRQIKLVSRCFGCRDEVGAAEAYNILVLSIPLNSGSRTTEVTAKLPRPLAGEGWGEGICRSGYNLHILILSNTLLRSQSPTAGKDVGAEVGPV
ncbi:MAG: hypothetical protein ACYC27_07065 [Armatimonadota bacterium]